MKKIIAFSTVALVTLSACSVAIAKETRADYCTGYEKALEYSLNSRGIFSPQYVFSVYKKEFTAYPLPDKDLKHIINMAFFDQRLSNVSGSDLQFLMQVRDSCMNGWKPKYQPLK